jgi:hypothetical protein
VRAAACTEYPNGSCGRLRQEAHARLLLRKSKGLEGQPEHALSATMEMANILATLREKGVRRRQPGTASPSTIPGVQYSFKLISRRPPICTCKPPCHLWATQVLEKQQELEQYQRDAANGGVGRPSTFRVPIVDFDEVEWNEDGAWDQPPWLFI